MVDVVVRQIVSGSEQTLSAAAAIALIRSAPSEYVLDPPGTVSAQAFVAAAMLQAYKEASGLPNPTYDDLIDALASGGSQLRSGAGVPSASLGANGDFYINTTAKTIYGPKTAGAWGSPTSLIGPAGAGSGNMVAATYDPNGHNTDAFARANHTGTQLLATISDAGDAASKNTGTSAGTVAAGNDSRITGAIQSSLLTTRGDVIRRGASAPERLALPSVGKVLMSDGTDIVGGYIGAPHAVIQDQKAQNTDGGGFTAGAWQDRDLNTEVYDPYGIVSISANVFTLAAGTYVVEWAAPARAVTLNQTRLFNSTDATVVGLGMSVDARNYSIGGGQFVQGESLSTGIARVTIAGSKGFKIQHWGTFTVPTRGFGAASNIDTEVFTTVKIWKVG